MKQEVYDTAHDIQSKINSLFKELTELKKLEKLFIKDKIYDEIVIKPRHNTDSLGWLSHPDISIYHKQREWEKEHTKSYYASDDCIFTEIINVIFRKRITKIESKIEILKEKFKFLRCE